MVAEIERMKPFLKGDEDFERMWRTAVRHATQDSIGNGDSRSFARVIGVADWSQYLETWRDVAGRRWPITSASPRERAEAEITKRIHDFCEALSELNETDDPERREFLINLCYFLMPKAPGLSAELDALVREFLVRYDEQFRSKE